MEGAPALVRAVASEPKGGRGGRERDASQRVGFKLRKAGECQSKRKDAPNRENAVSARVSRGGERQESNKAAAACVSAEFSLVDTAVLFLGWSMRERYMNR